MGLRRSLCCALVAAWAVTAFASQRPPVESDQQVLITLEQGLMTQAAKKLLEEFEALEDRDQVEVLAELLRRVALAPHDLPGAEDLTAAADRLFVELDRREQPQ